MKTETQELVRISKEMRRTIMRMAYKAGGSHIGPSFSCIDILVALYFGGILRYDAKNPGWEVRDRFILSKGHASAALYSVLSKAGYISSNELDTYCQKDSVLGGHPKMNEIPGVEASTGALGHGLLFAAGIALAGKLDFKDYRVFALLGDGECQEGSIWECALFAAQNKLDNLTAIIDYNKLQAMDSLNKIIGMEPLLEKWKAFGWETIEVDGHDIEKLVEVMDNKHNHGDQPRMIIAHTVKGKGVSFMENRPLWHYRLPNDEEMKIVLEELEFEDRGWLNK